MKTIFLCWFFMAPFCVFGQVNTVAAGKEVDSLLRVAENQYIKGDYPSMVETARVTCDKAKRYLGEESYGYGKALRTMANAVAQTPKIKDAEAIFIQAKDVLLTSVGANTSDYAGCLNELGLYYMNTGNLSKAEAPLLESREIRAGLSGKNNSAYSQSVSNISLLYYYRGEYEKSMPYCIEARDIISRIAGKDHPGYFTSTSILGSLYNGLGMPQTGLSYMLEARSIIENDKGRKHPNYLTIINNLALIYQNLGNYEQAESLLLESVNARREILGTEHKDYANALSSLANLYSELGQYENAEKLYREALGIRGKVLGKDNETYALNLSNLAVLFYASQRNKEALPFSLEAKDILEKKLGKAHPNYAVSLSVTGLIYMELGGFDSAGYYLEQSRSIREKISGKEHLDYATIIHNLASLYELTNRQDSALIYYLEAKNIREKNLGKTSKQYQRTLDNLCVYYLRNNEIQLARSGLLELNHLSRQHIEKNAAYLSEKELQKLLTLFSVRSDIFSSLNHLFKTDSFRMESFNNALFFKGVLLNGALSVEHMVQMASDSLQDIHERLKGCRTLLIKQYTKPIAERKNIEALEAKANALEKELIRSVAGFDKAARRVEWTEVRDRLQPGEAAVEFIHYRYFNDKARRTDSTLYAALLLLPTDTAPRFIPLCEQRQLDALIANPAQKEEKLYLQDVYWSGTQGRPSLYSLLWAPLLPLLKDVKTVYYSPSGLLHRLNLGAISADKRSNLSDTYRFVHLGSTRQLVAGTAAPVNGKPSADKTAMVYGGLRYDMDSTAIAKTNLEFPVDSTETKGSGLFHYADPKKRTRSAGDENGWAYLPETAVEADNIRTILRQSGISVKIRKGYEGSEESFKQLGKTAPSPNILHIATHGFFFPDPKDTLQGKRLSFGDEPAFKISEHPMIRSGLMLAGSQYAWNTGRAFAGMDDGILTAYEISQLNLSNTELVVLSACETGLGDIEGNEGVYGLQRAFKIAGAKYILMSLWKIPDAATRELMTVFYQKWLQEKMPVREALTAAQQFLRKQPRYRSPFYWAGFVLME